MEFKAKGVDAPSNVSDSPDLPPEETSSKIKERIEQELESVTFWQVDSINITSDIIKDYADDTSGEEDSVEDVDDDSTLSTKLKSVMTAPSTTSTTTISTTTTTTTQSPTTTTTTTELTTTIPPSPTPVSLRPILTTMAVTTTVAAPTTITTAPASASTTDQSGEVTTVAGNTTCRTVLISDNCQILWYDCNGDEGSLYCAPDKVLDVKQEPRYWDSNSLCTVPKFLPLTEETVRNDLPCAPERQYQKYNCTDNYPQPFTFPILGLGYETMCCPDCCDQFQDTQCQDCDDSCQDDSDDQT